MTLTRRSLTIALGAFLAIVIVVVTGVTLRDRLASTALGGRFLGIASPPVDEHADHEADDPHAGHQMEDPHAEHQPVEDHVHDPIPAPPAGTPRGGVAVDSRRQQLIGVRTVAVERRRLTQTIRTVGIVRYDETRLADVNLKVAGWIRELHVDYTGQLVRRGQPLFTLYSPELVTTQNEYLLALKTLHQTRDSQIAEAREYAERLVTAARERLVLWDLSADQIAELEQSGAPRTTLTFRSPVEGYVIEKRALAGQYVTSGQSLYTVANLAVVWVEADFYEQEVSALRVGAPVRVTLDAYPGETYPGRVVYVYPYAEEQSRTIRARLALANPRGHLRPGLFANVELDVALGEGLTVPANALLAAGRDEVVFVAQGDGYFEPRSVRAGRRLGEFVQILEGLDAGEIVADGAMFFIDSESQLRASLQGYAAPAAVSTMAGPARERLAIAFVTSPSPPRSGRNALEVTVRDASGRAVTDADVSVTFFMPPMPSMNMPAMQSQARLTHEGDGVYRGTGEIEMTGRWDVTVTVIRAGQTLGREQLSVVAR